MASVHLRWDMDRLGRFCAKAPETVEEITRAVGRIAETANSMSAGNVTGLYHPNHESPGIGHTEALYDSNVETRSNSTIGIAHTANYAAMRDNSQRNTLLKAMG